MLENTKREDSTNGENTPSLTVGQEQSSTQQTTCQPAAKDDDLSNWLDDFIAPKKPVAAPKPFTPPPVVFDAFVIFTKRGYCQNCHLEWEYPTYIGLRKPVKNGHAYLAYTPEMRETVRNLPRYEIKSSEPVPFCGVCFQGQEIPDETPRAQFHPSKVTTLDDLRLFASRNMLDLPIEPPSRPAHRLSDGREPS